MLFVFITVLLSVFAVLVLVAATAAVSSLFGCRFRKVFLKGLWALLLPPVLLLYGMLVERNLFEVSTVEVSSGDLPESFDGYRIVHISDLHLLSFSSRTGVLQKAVDKINALDADLVLFTGDMVTSQPSEMDGLENILAGIRAKDGVYSVLGNHDYCIYHNWKSDSLRIEAVSEVVSRQKKIGWGVLLNDSVDIKREDGSVSVVGVENISATTYFPSYGDLDKAMENAGGDFIILMSHDPTHWRKAISEYPDIDLTLSGHTHAMQFSLFGWSPSSLLFEEYKGIYSFGDNLLYVNIGLGETVIPARLGALPEITLLTLRSE